MVRATNTAPSADPGVSGGGTTRSPYALVAAVVLNRMEPGIFEEDKAAGGVRRAAKNRPKRA